MDDIEERAGKWVAEYVDIRTLPEWYDQWEESLITAYLAGSAQTQRDYTAQPDIK